MTSHRRVVVINSEQVPITGELVVQYGTRTWVVERSSLNPEIGPNGEIGYRLEIDAWLTDAPMPEGLKREYRSAQGMPDETTQGEGDTSNIPIQT